MAEKTYIGLNKHHYHVETHVRYMILLVTWGHNVRNHCSPHCAARASPASAGDSNAPRIAILVRYGFQHTATFNFRSQAFRHMLKVCGLRCKRLHQYNPGSTDCFLPQAVNVVGVLFAGPPPLSGQARDPRVLGGICWARLFMTYA